MGSINFVWGRPANYEAGWVYRLYERTEAGDVLVEDNIAGESFSLIMDGESYGRHVYFATCYDPGSRVESDPSNTAEVNFIKPQSPVGFTASWAG